MNKKIVSSSNLALRFEKSAGWTREILEPYLICGSLLDTQETHGDDPGGAYFLLDVGSQFDMKRLHDEQISKVLRTFNDYPSETDLEFMIRKNW